MLKHSQNIQFGAEIRETCSAFKCGPLEIKLLQSDKELDVRAFLAEQFDLVKG